MCNEMEMFEPIKHEKEKDQLFLMFINFGQLFESYLKVGRGGGTGVVMP